MKILNNYEQLKNRNKKIEKKIWKFFYIVFLTTTSPQRNNIPKMNTEQIINYMKNFFANYWDIFFCFKVNEDFTISKLDSTKSVILGEYIENEKFLELNVFLKEEGLKIEKGFLVLDLEEKDLDFTEIIDLKVKFKFDAQNFKQSAINLYKRILLNYIRQNTSHIMRETAYEFEYKNTEKIMFIAGTSCIFSKFLNKQIYKYTKEFVTFLGFKNVDSQYVYAFRDGFKSNDNVLSSNLNFIVKSCKFEDDVLNCKKTLKNLLEN